MNNFKELFENVRGLFEAIPEANKNGDCYVVSLKYMRPGLKLVHGLVDGQGALSGITYNHAWIEDGDKIIDLTLPKKLQKALPKKLYYSIGNIKTTFEYSFDEMNDKMIKEGTYGPWEKVLKKNKY